MLKIGDKCKVVRCRLYPKYVGQRIEIVNIHTLKNGNVLYETKEDDGTITVADETCLEKLDN